MDITNDSKNNLSVTNESKTATASLTWDEATMTWDEATFTWDQGGPSGLAITKDTKNSLSISNESKN